MTIRTYETKPGSLTLTISSLRLPISSSLGECNTIMVEPKMHNKQPIYKRLLKDVTVVQQIGSVNASIEFSRYGKLSAFYLP